jgi:hypothetical protein
VLRLRLGGTKVASKWILGTAGSQAIASRFSWTFGRQSWRRSLWRSSLGQLAAFFGGRLFAPEIASVQAEMKWLDVENPLFVAGPDAGVKFDKLMGENFQRTGFQPIIDRLRGDVSVRLFAVKLSNNTNLRTKEIEISPEYGAVLISDYGLRATTKELKLEPLNPRSDKTIYAMVGRVGAFVRDPVRILHDGRRVDISSYDLSDEFQAIVVFMGNYPTLSYVLAAAGAISLILLLLSATLELLFRKNMDLRARYTADSEIRKQVAFVDFVREKYPEKAYFKK